MRSIFSSSLMRALHLLGLGRLVAEAIDEGLEMLDLLALVLIRSQQLRAALVFLREVLRVVALVDGEALVPDLHGAIDGDVEEVAIVRDEDVAEGISLEIVLEPVAGFQVEMICRLVQKQEVGLGQQELGQRDTHLPAAGELIGLARPVFLGEAQAGEHCAHLRIERVAVERVKAVLQQRKALGSGLVFGAGVIEFGELRRPGARSRCSISRISSKTVRHSSKTVRPVSARPSCGR